MTLRLSHSPQKIKVAAVAAASAFDAPPEDIFASQKKPDKDDIFGSSVKQPLRKPEKSLDELLVGKAREETDSRGKVRGRGREMWELGRL